VIAILAAKKMRDRCRKIEQKPPMSPRGDSRKPSPGCYVSYLPNGDFLQMNVFSFAESFAHHMSTFQLDDSSVALIALLVGMIGGYRLTGWHAQLKAKRARIAGKPQAITRKRE
jgi:hypothetical protein